VLSGKYKPGAPPPKDSRAVSEAMGHFMQRWTERDILEAVEKLKPLAQEAHCTLAQFWAARLGKAELVAYQASPRGGVVRVRPQGDRVILGGQAVTVLRGELM